MIQSRDELHSWRLLAFKPKTTAITMTTLLPPSVGTSPSDCIITDLHTWWAMALVIVLSEFSAPSSVFTRRWMARIVATLAVLTRVAFVANAPGKSES